MQVTGSWTNFYKKVLDSIYPPKCSLCEVLSSENPCGECQKELGPSNLEFEEFHDGVLDYCFWLFPYEGRASQAVRHLKYRRATALAEWMAQQLADAHEAIPIHDDGVIPVPIHWTRRAVRGFNQSELLAERMEREQLLPDLLLRIKATKSQAGLNQAERLKNLNGAFRTGGTTLAGKSLLLIDDVMTTGHTLRMCAKELKLHGATSVGALVFARSPQPPKSASAT